MAERTPPCPDEQVLVALALGELTGRTRADALAHLVGCRACREQTDWLVEVTERVLLVAPEAEPPAGFESAALARMGADAPARARRGHRVARALAMAVVVAVAVLAGTLLAEGGRAEVAQADMVTPAGRDVGEVWRYESDPSWVLLSVPGWQVWDAEAGPGTTYLLRADLDDGSTVDLGEISFHSELGTWATSTSLDVGRITSVEVVDTGGRTWCEGRF